MAESPVEAAVHDVVLIGLGPANLALAAALDELEAPLDLLCLERKPSFSWQDGMLLPDARMQVSCLKDLATLRDPRSRFTFLSYLKARGRLDRFVNLGTLRPTRAEFNDYLTWAADQVGGRVRYGQEVVSVEPLSPRGSTPVRAVRVRTRDARTGAPGEHVARHLVLGAGAPPRLPRGVTVTGSRRMCHAGEVVDHLARHLADRAAEVHLVVVGDGQSGAEIFHHLGSRYPRARVTAITRGIGYRPADDTPFVNEVFSPAWVDVFHGLDPARRSTLLRLVRNTNYGAVDTNLIQMVYRSVYESEVDGSERLVVRPFLDLRTAEEGPDGVTLELDNWLSDSPVRIKADAVVFATGYATPHPHPLLAGLAPYLRTDQTGAHAVGRDYRVASTPGFTPSVFLQGYAEGTHGISDTLLSIVGVRAGEIAASLQALVVRDKHHDRAATARPRPPTTHGGQIMHIHRFDPSALEGDHGYQGARVVPADGLPDLPFGSMWSVVSPGRSSSAEMHHECELFLIAEGDGEARIGAERRPVKTGDAVYVPPFTQHAFANTSTLEPLRYVSLWWEDGPLTRRAEQDGQVDEQGAFPHRVLLTATPPTVNGPLHLGHISGPYLAADVCRRYLTLRGRDAHYVSGSDENQSYVVTKARQKGWSPQATAERFGDEVEQGLAALSIQPQVFARPTTSPHHTRFCQEFFARLYADGKLERRTSPSLHCDTCDRYLFEAHVSGLCPHCGHSSDGSACEDCARPNDCVDLVDPRCHECGGTPSVRDVERLYFPLSRYESELRDRLATITMSPHMRALCETMLAEGLPDLPVTHLADWGIDVPVPGFEGQVIYVWFEMCPGYLAATQLVAEQDAALSGWEDLWKDPVSEVVQFFGFDNGYFHALLFPALLIAYDSSIRLPTTFVTNEFYLLDGSKFSSSREHAIWATDFAAHQPADWVRFYLSLDRPEGRRTNFTLEQYEATVRDELQGRWLGWLAAVGARAEAEFGGRAPVTATYTPAHRRFFHQLVRAIREMEESLEPQTFSPPQAVRVLGELVRTAEAFGTAESCLDGLAARPGDRRTAVALELAAVRSLATLAAPLLPDLASQLWRALGFPGEGPDGWPPSPEFVPDGQDVRGLQGLQPW